MNPTNSSSSQGYYDRRQNVTDLLKEILQLLNDLNAAPGTAGTQGPARVRLEKLIRRHDEEELTVAVLALAKSGKSTFLNAICGAELLPSNNVPETARICCLHHDPIVTPETATLHRSSPTSPTSSSHNHSSNNNNNNSDTDDHKHTDNDNNNDHKLNTTHTDCNNGNHNGPNDDVANPGDDTPNTNTNTSTNPGMSNKPPLAVGVPSIHAALRELNAVVRKQAQGPGSSGTPDVDLEEVLSINVAIPALLHLSHGYKSDITIQFFDTPGPNESGVAEVRHKVERILEEMDVIIYLLDYTKLKTQDEAELFSTMRQINPQLVQRLASRLFFVVNKIDVEESQGGLSKEETREYVAGLVTQQMGVPGFKLTPDMVFCVSALDALLARLILTGQANADTKKKFCAIQFGRRKNYQEVSDDEYRAAAGDVFPDTGLGQLEDRLIHFLHAKGAAVKLMATTDDCCRIIGELSNSLEVSHAVLQQKTSEIHCKVVDLRQQLEAAVKHFDDVKQEVEQVEMKVTANIIDRLNKLRLDLKDKVRYALGLEHKEEKKGPLKGLWQALASTAARVLGGKRSAEDEGVVRDSLTDLLQHINEALAEEIKDCLHQVEVDAKGQQHQLFAVLNRQIAVLAGRMESVLQEQLKVELQPVELSLKPPSAEQLHIKVQDIIDKGIKRAERQEHHRVQTGLCPWQTELQTNTVTYFEMQPEAIASQCGQLIDSHVDASIRAVQSLVASIMDGDVSAAQHHVSSYAQRYMGVMEQALQENEKGEQNRQQALHGVCNWMEKVGDMMDSIQQLRASLDSVSVSDIGEEEVFWANVWAQAVTGRTNRVPPESGSCTPDETPVVVELQDVEGPVEHDAPCNRESDSWVVVN